METVLTGAAAKVASEAAKGIFAEIKRHMRYVIIYKKNVDKFEEKLKMLMAKRTNVQQEVDAADRNGEKIKEDVELWRNTVDKVINEEGKKVKDLEDKAKNKCLIGLCPNIKSRYQLSKKAEEVVAAVDDLIQQYCQFNGVAYRDVLEAPKCAPPKNFEAFDSRKEVFDGVIEALKDSTIGVIGVCGTGGVGKTTLVNQVTGQVQEDKLFDRVVKATVTQTPNIQKIQDEIADFLRLSLEGTSIPVRALSLSVRLKKEKKILVVLDDIWARLDLEQVGIPSGDQQEGCKILLTSRNQIVLTNEMDAKKTFVMDVLEEKEAWELFKKMAENDFENRDPFRSVATEVAKKCEGLPVAIVTVATALRNQPIYAWNDANLQLQRPSPSNFTGIPHAVYSAIQISYNNLESEELRQTFLLCGLLGHNARTEDLVRYGLGLRSFGNVNKVEDTRNRVLTLVRKLKAFCLLRDSYSDDRFDMHDFDCDVALAIASRDNHAFALKHKGFFDDWPDEERMRNFKMISLSFDSVEKLPHELECPQLTFFSMGSKDSDVEMPANFFEKMKNLKVLDLLKMKIFSINLPTSLRTLCLSQCVLGDMVNLGKLKNLEILRLFGVSGVMLPKEIVQLTKLRLLDLSNCDELIILAGVLSSLSKLEELYIGTSFVKWDLGSNARVAELKDLSGLTALDVCIPNAGIVLKDLFSEKLRRYKIVIGSETDWYERIEYSRILKLKVGTSIDNLGDGVLRLLKETEALYLKGPEGVKIALNNRGGFLHLKHLHIEDDPKRQSALFDEEVGNPHLRLSDDTSELMEIRRRNPQEILPFKHIEVLEVDDCSTWRCLFTLSMALGLPQLRVLSVKNCIVMEHIIIEEGSDEQVANETVFPLLRSITLESCADLASFYQGSKSLECPSLEKVDVCDCPKMFTFASTFSKEQRIEIIDAGNTTKLSKRIADTAFFDNMMDFPCLADLSLGGINFERIWHNQFSIRSDYTQNLTTLYIWGCDNFKHLLSFSMVKSLTHLKRFEVKECKCLREIIFTEDIEDNMMDQIFPKLEHLQLEGLPELTRFYHGSHCEFPLLKEFIIWNCPTFETFISKSILVSEIHIIPSKWPSLKRMKVYRCDKVEIFASENLLSFGESTNQQPLFWVNEVTFPNLEELTLEGNGIMKEIWHGQLRAECDEGKRCIVFTRLKYLKLSSLPTLASFCLGDQIFEFPALENMIVTACPKMKIFCQGDLSTPQLQKVISKDEGEEKGWWEGDLKTTIKWMFEEKIAYCDVRLSDTSELMKIWSRNPQEILTFKYLEKLEVDDFVQVGIRQVIVVLVRHYFQRVELLYSSMMILLGWQPYSLESK
ncbi:NB-ARC domain-containing disease resistance protein, putative [Theobroma cacao]|uniref:NB-ARC domain-containing disease resistance protein, putative n=1 Tax=Theobroma cacao TaxID=3641 RepID=A0A061F3K8_THECC|nr:NB-ARC domain-containing disease resistance protein, putative [Theobroma cacao]